MIKRDEFMIRCVGHWSLLFGILLLMLSPAVFRVQADDLEDSFRQPPATAKPRTWWHWLDGNITRQGITKDLEAMQRIGLGGVYMFNAGMGFPDGPVRFLEPRWREMFRHTVREAERLGLKFGVHNCDGFSQSGGPWITPERSMKQLTWSATDVAGPGPYSGTLPRGEFQEDFYRDIAVIAFPLPQGTTLTGPGREVEVRGSLPASTLAALVDGDLERRVTIRPAGPKPDALHTIEFHFDQPRTVRSVVSYGDEMHHWEEDFPVHLEARRHGRFERAASFTINWDMSHGESCTAAVPETTGRVFRLAFHNPWPIRLREFQLSSAAKVHFAEAKAGRLHARGHGAWRRHADAYPGPGPTRTLDRDLVLDSHAIRNLSDRLAPDGKLSWQAPPGKWRVLRIGYTSTAKRVGPATREGAGLECDKLDRDAVRFHLNHYVGRLVKLAGEAAGKTFAVMEVDSWEAGIQNWTAKCERRFQDRLGYDLLPYLPLLLEGWVIDNVDESNRVLWDWRRFLADQLSESYFAEVARFAAEHGLTYVGESTGRQQFLYDIAYLRNSAVPMGEFWLDTGPGQGVRVDNKLAASVAHTTGRRIVASEAYTCGPATARWQNHPFSIKALGDKALTMGINQFVFHTFAHQPYEVPGPGFTFFHWGLNFNRNNTWWETGHAWIGYLTRCNSMLRQGHSVADVLFYLGEDVPNRIYGHPQVRSLQRAGYDFDGCDTQALLSARVVDRRIVLPGGCTYRVLLLPALETMRPTVLEKIHTMVRAGAAVLGNPPKRSPSLPDLGKGDRHVRRLAAELWGERPAPVIDRQFGKGRVFRGISLTEALARCGAPPDFLWTTESEDAEILYTHRRTSNADLYFVSNQRNQRELVEAAFRAGNREPEIWNPADGSIQRVAVYRRDGDHVHVPLRLNPCEAVFVVFRKPATRHIVALKTTGPAGTSSESVHVTRTLEGILQVRFREAGGAKLTFNDGTSTTVQMDHVPGPIEVGGPWQVRFPPGLGAPAEAHFEKLIAWPDHQLPGIRFFSGTATYQSTFTVPAGRLAPDRRLALDLGKVFVIAQVTLNGRDLGVLWKPPFRVDISDAARVGENRLEVRVTNLWPNRMIGDATLPDDVVWRSGRRPFPARWPDFVLHGGARPSGRTTFATRKDVYRADSPLLPSGLLGPVRLQTVVVQHIGRSGDSPAIPEQ